MRLLARLVVGALLQRLITHGVAGRLASDPSRSCGLAARGMEGGRVMEINLPCTVILPNIGRRA